MIACLIIQELSEFAGLTPHIFAVGETALRNMLEQGIPQSVIVSGESGAGKVWERRACCNTLDVWLIRCWAQTVTSRYLMQYFTMVAGKDRAHLEVQREIDKRVVVSNAILEALGNATTLRNENSSRFGKYLSLHFGV